jgi:hypothetical protein
MLYGFGNKGEIIVVAADSLKEFEDASRVFTNLGIEFTIPSLMTIVQNKIYRGLEVAPLILTAGDITTDTLVMIERDQAIITHSEMMETSLSYDSTSELYSLFEAQTETVEHEIAVTWDLENDDLFPADDRILIFTTYHDAHSGTVAIITSRDALLKYKMPLHAHFSEGARIQKLIDIPARFTEEIAAGCFVYDGSPLAARAALLQHGLREDRVLSRMIQVAFGGRPDASTVDETAFALGMVTPIEGKDFIFALTPHPEKPSTFVTITPHVHWSAHKELPLNIYLSPLIARLLPQGYGESQPGIFEVLRDTNVVREQLVRAGMSEHNSLRDVLADVLNGIVVTAPPPPVVQAAIDWDKFIQEWPTQDKAARLTILPNNRISFSILETSTSSCYVFFVPTSYFVKENNLLPIDLELEDRLMSMAEKSGDNVFKVIGPDPIQIRATLTKDGFIDDYALTLFVTMALYSGDLGSDIGFDPLA